MQVGKGGYRSKYRDRYQQIITSDYRRCRRRQPERKTDTANQPWRCIITFSSRGKSILKLREKRKCLSLSRVRSKKMFYNILWKIKPPLIECGLVAGAAAAPGQVHQVLFLRRFTPGRSRTRAACKFAKDKRIVDMRPFSHLC